MIRVIQCDSQKNAKGYYTKGDYYASDRQELPGFWGGKAAERLGLQGIVQKRGFDRLCSNQHPFTGDQLTARMRKDRTPGYDFSFHAPKSISLLYGLTGDPAILDAFRSAYRQAMQAMEAEMQARVRKGGQMANRTVGNMAWAEYIHLTARPVKGNIDPHLHVHVFVLNTVFDPVEQIWKAGNFRDLKRDAPRFEVLFHRLLASRLTDLGIPIVRNGKHCEIAGVDRATIDKFSLRTQQVNRTAERWGITDPKAKDGLGATTREYKQNAITLPELRKAWRARLTGDERAILEQAIPRRPPPLAVWKEERQNFILHQQRQESHQLNPNLARMRG